MIGWIGPALLLALFAAASLSAHGLAAPDAAVAAQVEELQAPRLVPATEVRCELPAAVQPLRLPRPTSRQRCIAEGGLPPPRAPTC